MTPRSTFSKTWQKFTLSFNKRFKLMISSAVRTSASLNFCASMTVRSVIMPTELKPAGVTVTNAKTAAWQWRQRRCNKWLSPASSRILASMAWVLARHNGHKPIILVISSKKEGRELRGFIDIDKDIIAGKAGGVKKPLTPSTPSVIITSAY